MSNTKTTCKCPKCEGTGTINAFRHIENGGCFDCGGTGSINAIISKRKGISKDVKNKIEFLENCTQQTIEKMTYKQLMNAREFAATCGFDDAHHLFNRKFGGAFQIAQNKMIEKHGV